MSGHRNRIADAPLLAWGEELRTRKRHRARIAKRVATGAVGVIVVLASAMLPPSPRLVWNASASAPIGLYGVDPYAHVATGDMVIARTPEPFRAFAAARRYVPSNVPLVKRVTAIAGDEICAFGARIFVNGRPVAMRRGTDGHGRPMPFWSGCRHLHEGQYFLLNDDPASFDSRYFGPTNRADLIGKARLLWR